MTAGGADDVRLLLLLLLLALPLSSRLLFSLCL